jgi:hypothetical protein
MSPIAHIEAGREPQDRHRDRERQTDAQWQNALQLAQTLGLDVTLQPR